MVGCLAITASARFAPAAQKVPEISNVFPDFATESPSVSPHIITGEEFDPTRTEVWILANARDTSTPTNTLAALGDSNPALPERPPKEARRLFPLDIERQIIVAPLEGFAVWVRTAAGTSSPYPINLPKPCWLSQDTAEPGETLHLFGFGLLAPWRPCYLALVGGGRRYLLRPFPPSRDQRAEDSTLLYFDLPADALPGPYSVFVHNGYGGGLGWRKAGALTIVAHRVLAEAIFNVKEYGARGDSEGNDYAAITNALAAAQSALTDSIRPVVYFPPGKWRTDTTIQVPSGVTLRGASRDLSIIEGFGVLPPDRKTTALVYGCSHTTLESLTFQGFTVKGPADYWDVLVVLPPPRHDGYSAEPVADFTLRHCRLNGSAAYPDQPHASYRMTLSLSSVRGAQILDNEIFGQVGLGRSYIPSYRLEFIGNTIHGGTGNVSLEAGQLFDSIIDGTQVRDPAARFMVNARRHCAIRFNEVHDYHRAIWANAEETFLVHGDVFKSGGRATAAAQRTLTDSSKHWPPGLWRDAEVLIISGRGFGQYRPVSDSTSDTLTLAESWRVPPDSTSRYTVGNYFVENSWYANFNDTPGRMSLWLECIGNVVEKHRDAFGGGLDIWGQDRTRPNEPIIQPFDQAYTDHHFMPSWYNLVHDGWFDGSIIRLWSNTVEPTPFAAPALFGNFIVGNHLRQSHTVRTGFERTPHIDGAIWIGNRSGPDMTHPATKQVALSHTIVAGNTISHTPRGISVSDTARKTFLISNEFEAVERPVLNWGSGTVQQGNRTYSLDERGEHLRDVPPPTK